MSCACGSFRAELAETGPSHGSLITCYCKDCQAFANHLGATARVANPRGGTALYQTIPANWHILTGHERLRCLRLSPKGLLRWYAGCCNTPLANTLHKPGMAFVGVVAGNVDRAEALGPMTAVVRTESASASIEGDDAPVASYGFAASGFRILSRLFRAKLAGRGRSPFFDENGVPVAQPEVLSLDQRRAATPE